MIHKLLTAFVSVLVIVISLMTQTSNFALAASLCPALTNDALNPPELIRGITEDNVFKKDIRDYLNQGGRLSGLRRFTIDEKGRKIGSLLTVDLNKDGIEEILLSSSIYNSHGLYGWVAIYECQNGKYVANDFVLNDYIYELKVVRIVDLMNRGYPQIILGAESQSNACYHWPIVIGWDAKKYTIFQNHDRELTVNCPATIRVIDYDGDSQRDIYIKGRTSVPLGSNEKSKGVIKVFTWDEDQFIQVEASVAP